MFDNSNWIWHSQKFVADEYVTFVKNFNYESGKAILRLVAETNYIAYLNGKRIAFGQFAGYKNKKYYDQIILNNLNKGENQLKITVWYEGLDTFTHIEDGAGLIFEVVADENVLCVSDQTVLCGVDNAYVNYQKRLLTIQIGYTSSMVSGGQVDDFSSAVVIKKDADIVARPVKKLVEEQRIDAKKVDLPKKQVYDLGAESVGYLFLDIDCDSDCLVTVAYGEHILDGEVRRIIGGGYLGLGRDFSLDFKCKKGKNVFENFFVRLGARYLEVITEANVNVNAIGILPVFYPVTEKKVNLSGLDKEIYDTSVRTLKLCMHEHYEDCPWREQALYALDSRNQMLCGYYAFNQSEFARENLLLMLNGKREDGLFELTFPAVNTPSIPFFSLVYPIAVEEYVKHTGDKSILVEAWDTLEQIMDIFSSRIDQTGLIKNFTAPYWNFYEWTEGSDGTGELESDYREEKYELILNCAFVLSARSFNNLAKLIGKTNFIETTAVKEAIDKTFYDKEKNLYYLSTTKQKLYSQLGNAFAVLIGLGNKGVINAIKEDKTLIPATLSMLGFIYDALLVNDKENGQFVLEDIRQKYAIMLNKGATSWWETLGGVTETDKACSLCHGWSSIPIYYYNKILGEEI